MTYGNSEHRSHGFKGLSKTVRETTALLRPHREDFDAIICTGISGLLVASPVALRLKKPLLVLRKADERCHGKPGEILGWDSHFERILFFDDFVSTGDTLRTCQEAISRTSTPSGFAQIVLTCEYQPCFGIPAQVSLSAPYTSEGS